MKARIWTGEELAYPYEMDLEDATKYMYSIVGRVPNVWLEVVE